MNLGGVKPNAFQNIILNSKKKNGVNILDNTESTSAYEVVHKYVALLDAESKLNLRAFITGNVSRFGTRELEELNDAIF